MKEHVIDDQVAFVDLYQEEHECGVVLRGIMLLDADETPIVRAGNFTGESFRYELFAGERIVGVKFRQAMDAEMSKINF